MGSKRRQSSSGGSFLIVKESRAGAIRKSPCVKAGAMAAKKPTAARTLGVNGSTLGSHGSKGKSHPAFGPCEIYISFKKDDVPELLDFVAPC
jgi:hypothetical protein